MKVHFNKSSIATILSFKEVADIPGVRITTDIEKERAMTVSLGNGSTIKFKECESGLYFHDTEKEPNNEEEINNINGDVIDYYYLQTVQENKKYLTWRLPPALRLLPSDLDIVLSSVQIFGRSSI